MYVHLAQQANWKFKRGNNFQFHYKIHSQISVSMSSSNLNPTRRLTLVFRYRRSPPISTFRRIPALSQRYSVIFDSDSTFAASLIVNKLSPPLISFASASVIDLISKIRSSKRFRRLTADTWRIRFRLSLIIVFKSNLRII